MKFSDIWWNVVPGGVSVINDITTSLHNGNVVVLKEFPFWPWSQVPKDKLKKYVNQHFGSGKQHLFDGADLPKPELFKDCFSPRRYTQYRPYRRFGEFLAETDRESFHDSTVWITGIKNGKAFQEWLEVINDYKTARKNKKQARFILETEGGLSMPKNLSGFTETVVLNNIESFDLLTFAMLGIGSSLLPESRPIAAERAVMLCNKNLELCACLLEQPQQLIEDPKTLLKNVLEKKTTSNGGRFPVTYNEEESDSAIWQANVKHLFPLLENIRLAIIKIHKTELDQLENLENSLGESVVKSESIETGLLYALSQGIAVNQPCSTADLFSGTEAEKIKLIRDVRNELAHLKPISTEMMRNLFEVSKVM